MDRSTHLPLSGWLRPKPGCGVNTVLASGAGVLCGDYAEGKSGAPKLRCWTAESAEEIALPKALNGYQLNQAAITSARVIAEKWVDPRFALLSPRYPQRRVVLDLRSGKQISSWKPRPQRAPTNPWFPCALSPSGELLAESGDERLELYGISP